MVLEKKQKEEVRKKYSRNAEDTGSSEAQIAMLTQRIGELTQHLNEHSKDFSSRRGLLKMVAQRRKLLNYLHKTDENKYKEISKSLGL